MEDEAHGPEATALRERSIFTIFEI